MKFNFVVTGRNCLQWVGPCLDSIAAQKDQDFDVCIVDDASDEMIQRDIVRRYAHEYKWALIQNETRQGAMFNQYTAWNALAPNDGDVVVWVDLDDRLAHANVLNVLRRHYDDGALMTYGSYTPDPPSSTCLQAAPYPEWVVKNRYHRGYHQFLFNHLRTVSWDVLRRIDEREFRDHEGKWFMSACDAAVMMPAMEIAGERCHVIDEILYIYTSDNSYSDWRIQPERVNIDHDTILSRPVSENLL